MVFFFFTASERMEARARFLLACWFLVICSHISQQQQQHRTRSLVVVVVAAALHKTNSRVGSQSVLSPLLSRGEEEQQHTIEPAVVLVPWSTVALPYAGLVGPAAAAAAAAAATVDKYRLLLLLLAPMPASLDQLLLVALVLLGSHFRVNQSVQGRRKCRQSLLQQREERKRV